jgi:hypothetical protein
MWKHNKTNRFLEWFRQKMNKEVKPTKFGSILWNFILSGIVVYFLGCLGWVALYINDIKPFDSLNSFIVFTFFVTLLWIGELRVCIFYEKYFIEKDFKYHKKETFNSPLIKL